MTDELQMKLQALLDGELPEKEAREVEAWLERDSEATALRTELKNTCHAFKNATANVAVPESREFYWSKIRREIERLEPVRVPEKGASWFTFLSRALVPVGSIAALAIGIIVAVHPFSAAPSIHVNAMLADVGGFTYRDDAQGMTVIWLGYPAEKTVAENNSSDTPPAE